MSAQHIINILENTKISAKEDLEEMLKFFYSEFCLSSITLEKDELEKVVGAFYLKIKTLLSNNFVNAQVYVYIYKNIKAMIEKIEKDYKESSSLGEDFIDNFLNLNVQINNLLPSLANAAHSNTKIKLTSAQALAFIFSSNMSGMDKMDVRRVNPMFKKCAFHPTIGQDIEINNMQIKKTVSIEDWFISSGQAAPGFFSAISSNPLNTATHLISFVSKDYPAEDVINYLEFLNIPNDMLCQAISAKIKAERKYYETNTFAGTSAINEQLVLLEKYLLEKAVISVKNENIDTFSNKI